MWNVEVHGVCIYYRYIRIHRDLRTYAYIAQIHVYCAHSHCTRSLLTLY
jgi:hypothetical protein